MYGNYAEQKESGVIRTQFENGPPRQARFKSRTLKTRNCQLYIDGNQNFQNFESFVVNDLAQGALFFNFTDPLTGQTAEGRLVGGMYSAAPIGVPPNRWVVSCQIESWSL
jgi:hypothetical protein